MAVEDVAGHTAVAYLVSDVELRSVQDALGRNTWVSARTATQFWGNTKENAQHMSAPSVHMVRQTPWLADECCNNRCVTECQNQKCNLS